MTTIVYFKGCFITDEVATTNGCPEGGHSKLLLPGTKCEEEDLLSVKLVRAHGWLAAQAGEPLWLPPGALLEQATLLEALEHVSTDGTVLLVDGPFGPIRVTIGKEGITSRSKLQGDFHVVGAGAEEINWLYHSCLAKLASVDAATVLNELAALVQRQQSLWFPPPVSVNVVRPTIATCRMAEVEVEGMFTYQRTICWIQE